MPSPLDTRALVLSFMEQIGPVRQRLLVLMAEAFTHEVKSRIETEAGILTPDIATAIEAQLLLHHATHAETLGKKSFEYMLKYACEAAGISVALTSNPTYAGKDIKIEGKRYSLKTQADKAIKKHSTYIQKFMEARWIRNYNSIDEIAEATRIRVSAHLDHYEHILMWRAFVLDKTHYRYELIEIPLELLRLVEKLPNSAFCSKNEFGSCGGDVVDSQGTAFRIWLDGSVEKVRFFNIRTNRCIFHGEWIIPRLIAIDDDEIED